MSFMLLKQAGNRARKATRPERSRFWNWTGEAVGDTPDFSGKTASAGKAPRSRGGNRNLKGAKR